MRNIAICSRNFSNSQGNAVIDLIQMEGVEVHCGLVYTPDPQFDRSAPENCSKVLLKVLAFSCNYNLPGFEG